MSYQRAPEPSVFAALGDLSLRRYATPQLLRYIYIVGLVITLLAGVGYLIGGLAAGGVIAVITVVVVPLGTFLGVLYVRVLTELGSVVFRIAENVELIAHGGGSAAMPFRPGPTSGGPPAGPAAGPPPSGGPGGGVPPSAGWQPPQEPPAGGPPPTWP